MHEIGPIEGNPFIDAIGLHKLLRVLAPATESFWMQKFFTRENMKKLALHVSKH